MWHCSLLPVLTLECLCVNVKPLECEEEFNLINIKL